jgi:bifunctional DNA-binding transcriptional regulator/antitoxin component of YhaV-PrlF toxin-antitoxin module
MVKIQKLTNKGKYDTYLIYIPKQVIEETELEKGDDLKLYYEKGRIMLVK